MTRVDAQEMKRRIPIDRVLAQFGGEPWGGNGTWDRWVPVRCPFHYDRRASASIHKGRGLFRCHGCDAGGDIFDIVQQELHTDFNGAYEWLTNFLR